MNRLEIINQVLLGLIIVFVLCLALALSLGGS